LSTPEPPSLAASGAEDENSNLELLRFALELRKLTELPGRPAALALMHPVKNPTKDNLLPRGGGAFINEIDGNLTLWAEGERETTELHWGGKLRGPTFDPIAFAMDKGTCAGLADAKGRLIPSVWAHQVDATRADQAADRARSDEDQVLLLMSIDPEGSFASWAITLGWTMPSGPAKYRVERAIQRLANHRLVARKRDRWTVTKAGKAEVNRLQERAR
jgi:hypothetical protein